MPAAIDDHLPVDDEFLVRLARDRDALAALWPSLAGSLDEATRASIEILCHRLAGAAGVFGLAALGDAAAGLEDLTRADAPNPQVPALREAADRLLREMDLALGRD